MLTRNLKGKNTPFFDKETTLIIKGIALLMMFAHHFFTFPEWWIDGIKYPVLEQLAPYFSSPLKLCVSIFCFLSGYFYYYAKDKTYSYSARKITDLLIDYWGVFFLFAFIAILTVGYYYTPGGIIAEMFALNLPTMTFCWYVYFYYIYMLLFPLMNKLIGKNVFLDLLISIILVPKCFVAIDKIYYIVFGNSALHYITNDCGLWLPTVLLGYIFARYMAFEWLDNHLKRIISTKVITIILCVVGLLCIPMGKLVFPSITFYSPKLPVIQKSISFYISMDIIYAPLFIYCIVALSRTVALNYTKMVLKQIGKYSLLMWFVSCIFFNNAKSFSQPFLYWPHNPILVMIWGTFLCYVISLALSVLLNRIKKKKNDIIFK